MNAKDLSQLSQEELQNLLAAVAIYIGVFIFYKAFKYIWFSIQLWTIGVRTGSKGYAWMAWFPVFRTYLIARSCGKPWWFIFWLLLYVPSHLFIIFLFVENFIDMVETGVKVARGDIFGFLSELIGEDYSEAYQLMTAVSIRISTPLLLYAALARKCKRSELWSLVINLLPFLNLVAIWWIRLGSRKLMVTVSGDAPDQTVNDVGTMS